MVAKFLEDIEGITTHPDQQDKWVQKGDSSGNYTMRNMYMLLMRDSTDENQDGAFNEL